MVGVRPRRPVPWARPAHRPSPTARWVVPPSTSAAVLARSPTSRQRRRKEKALFTGIVEEKGELVSLDLGTDSARLVVRGPRVVADAHHGDSIAVDGVCLTVVRRPGTDGAAEGCFAVDVMGESLRRTSLGARRPGDRVNLERATPASGRLGGHVVQGHVDGVGHVIARTPGERWELVRLSVPTALARYVAEKGSVTVDGVSLTVTAVGDDGSPSGPAGLDLTDETSWFEVGLIPTTLAETTLGERPVGAAVNLEVDVLAKYVERLLTAPGARS